MNSDFNNNYPSYYPPYANINSLHDAPSINNNTQTYIAVPHNSSNLPNLSTPHASKNQISLDEFEKANLQKSLRSNGQTICCPYCKNVTASIAEKTCSTKNVLCCVFFGALVWLGYQAVKGKDINCYDADHYCVKCRKKIGTYNAC